MTTAVIAEPTLGQTERENDTEFSTRRGQIRYLMGELSLTSAQAANMIRAYTLDQRDREAREFIREEFGPWMRRRGDLLVVRSKAQHGIGGPGWRVTS